MTYLKRSFQRLRNFVTNRHGHERLQEEIEMHLAALTEENIRAGMTPAEAARQARVKFGSKEVVRAEYHAETTLPLLEDLLRDGRYALRVLRKSPIATVLTVLVLGLGIGANTAVFSVVNAVLLRPLPYPEPERLMVLSERMPSFDTASVSYPDYLDWRATQDSCTDLAYELRSRCNVSFSSSGVTPPERVSSAQVSGNFLTALDVKPALGRDFSEVEDRPGGPKVVLLGDTLWRQHFNGDRAVLGQHVVVNGVPREIIGVLPPTMGFPQGAVLFLPLGDLRKDPLFNARNNRNGYYVLGRLKPGVTRAQADQDLNRTASELARRYPDSNAGVTAHALPLLAYSVGDYGHSLYLLMAMAGCVLLVACANVANLQLARAAARERELALRAVLGAGRWRLIRQVLTESAVLGLLGGMVALLFAIWAVDVIVALSPAGVPRFYEAHLDLAALGFTAAIATGTIFLVGGWPAWRMSRMATMATALHEGSARGSSDGRGQRRTRACLVIAQMASAVVLLAGAGLTIKSFWRARNESLGFRSDGLLMMSISLPETSYPEAKIAPFLTDLLNRVRALPGVTAVATGDNVPFDDNESDSGFHVTGTPPAPPGHRPQAELNFTSPGYFETMGIPLLRGRDFGAQDTPAKPRSVIIDETFARRYFPGKDPVGQHIDDNQSRDENAPPLTVVGVVAYTLNDPPGTNPALAGMVQMTLCANQMPQPDVMLMVRVSAGDPLRLAEPVRKEVLALDADLPVAQVTTMDASVAAGLTPRRLTTGLLCAFAVLALVLASIGLYGVMALSVAQRTRELGIRLALGASRTSILGLVLRQGAKLAGIGLLLGVVVALLSGKLLASFLFGVEPNDFPTLGLVVVVLSAASLFACWLPTRRATRVDPMVALRSE